MDSELKWLPAVCLISFKSDGLRRLFLQHHTDIALSLRPLPACYLWAEFRRKKSAQFQTGRPQNMYGFAYAAYKIYFFL